MPQPLIGAATLAFALIVLGVSWFHEAGSGAIGQESAGIWLLTLCLVVGVPIAYWFPIYIRHSTKICVTTIPLYLMAALLPPPLAATAAGLGILSGEMAVRAQRRSHLSDVATHAGRWILLGLAGSVVAHLPVPAGAFLLHGVLLLGTGLVSLVWSTWSGTTMNDGTGRATRIISKGWRFRSAHGSSPLPRALTR